MKVTLETERLILRPFEVADAGEMFKNWAHDPEVTKYLTWTPHESAEETRALLTRWAAEYEKPERLNFAIERKEDGKLIGGIDVVGYLGGPSGTPMIGYNLARACWGRGYMTEACKRVVAYLFEKGYCEIRIDAVRENTASRRVIEKCGGRYAGSEEVTFDGKGKTFTVCSYRIVKRSAGEENGRV